MEKLWHWQFFDMAYHLISKEILYRGAFVKNIKIPQMVPDSQVINAIFYLLILSK